MVGPLGICCFPAFVSKCGRSSVKTALSNMLTELAHRLFNLPKIFRVQFARSLRVIQNPFIRYHLVSTRRHCHFHKDPEQGIPCEWLPRYVLDGRVGELWVWSCSLL